MALRTIEDEVRAYYGQVLRGRGDLRTGACCNAEALPPHARAAAERIHPEVRERFYGCGSPIPLAVSGCTVLDMGCGSGRDTYLLSSLVGPHGSVIGVDMTAEQIEVAARHREYHRESFGLARSNVELRHGSMEDLAAVGIADASVDVVISNCVLNLSPDKPRVFGEIFRVLRPGGELLFSDVFAGRRVPAHLREDPILLSECLGGSLYLEDFRRIMLAVGCSDHRAVTRRRIALQDPEIEARAGMIDFYSVTMRAFKLDDLEDRCEDYGEVARYRGTLEESPHAFVLDGHHRFEAGKPLPVCGNTASMLSRTRYARHFEVTGDRSVHYGLFPCGPAVEAAAGGNCC